MVTVLIIYDSQYWTPACNLMWLEESQSIIGEKLKCYIDNKVVYYCVHTSAKISMKPIQILYVPIKSRENSYCHHVGTWTLKSKRYNRTTKKISTTSFDILDSVQIDHLPNVCSLLMVLIQSELITWQKQSSLIVLIQW